MKMTVAHVVFNDIAMFKCMICAWRSCVHVFVKYCNVSLLVIIGYAI